MEAYQLLPDDKTALNESFNKLLIEKAILRDKLMRKAPSFVEKLMKKIKPNKKEQAYVMDVIYSGVKAGNKDYDVTDMKKVIDRLLDSGAETLILGCTELPVAMDLYKLNYPSCDPTLELARGTIAAANGVCI